MSDVEGRQPGELYHVSDVEGREKVERTYLSVGRQTFGKYIVRASTHITAIGCRCSEFMHQTVDNI